MRKSTTLVSNVEVTAHRDEPYGLPAHVRLHVLGTTATIWLSYDEVERLREVLNNALVDIREGRGK